MLQLRSLCSLFWGGKQLSSHCRNFLPMFVVVCLLSGGLNHMMFRFLLCLLLVVLSFSDLYFNVYVYLLFFRGSWYLCATWLKVPSFEDMLDSLLFLFSGMFGGWLLS